MRSKSEGMAGLLGRLLPAGVLAGALIGCDAPPDIQPIAPPGASLPRKSPDAEPAQAQGEMPVAAASAPTPPAPAGKKVPPATPTAKGETKTTSGGVKYETLKEGTGPELKWGDVGTFKYEGRLENGTVFDKSTYTTNLSAGGVIEGWQEGLTGMKVGELRKLTIPAEKGYGAQGHPPKIPANSTLVFEVELTSIPGK